MTFKNSTGKLTTTKYGEPYLWGSGDVTTLPSNENKITVSDAADFSGMRVAVGSSRIVIGSPWDDDNGIRSGAAYIYNLDGTNEIKITASDGAAEDYFGNIIDVGNGRIVVGAPWDDDNGTESGSAYIFDLDGTQLAKITASDAAALDYFGGSVAVGNGRIVVGARGDDDNGTESGSAYIFDLDGTQLAKITASDGAAGDYFGESVAVGNGRIVVGAYGDDGNGTGSAYIFSLNGLELAKIKASDGAGGDNFGGSVAVGNGRIVVGASGDDRKTSGYAGSAYIFDLNGNELAKITPSEDTLNDQFGVSVVVGNGRIVVGASQEDTGATNSGAVYIFDLDGNELAKIKASDGQFVSKAFGTSVDVGNGKIVVGSNGASYIYDTPLVYTPHDLIYNEV